MLQAFKEKRSAMLLDSENATIILKDDDEFSDYFLGLGLKSVSIKERAIAVIKDTSKSRMDLLIEYDGVIIIKKNKIDVTVGYELVEMGKKYIEIGLASYRNKSVNVNVLYSVIERIKEIIEE